MKNLIYLSFFINTLLALEISPMPIEFGEKRVELTKEYISKHYSKDVDDIVIEPKIIVIHHTGINSLKESFKRLNNEILAPTKRAYIQKASKLNVSAHFMIDFDGKIYQLMPENIMARHVIGLNYSSIGIENVGGEGDVDNLTPKQEEANIKLVEYLKHKFPQIEYLIGHFEYRNFENNSLWLEVDKKYRTIKSDPSKKFIEKIRENFQDLRAF